MQRMHFHRRSARLLSQAAACILIGGASATHADLIHRYSFNDADGQTVVADSVGTAHGTAVGGVSFDGTRAALDGSSGYIDLPNHLVSGLTNITIESWVTWNGGAAWQRIFDFGNSSNGEDASGTGQKYLFLSPRSGGGSVRFAITPDSGGQESPVLNGPSILADDGSEVHVAVTYGPGVARLYVNGQIAATGVYSTELAALDDVNVWLGRSNWPDPFFDGSFSEFRIHDSILSSPQLAAAAKAGPDSVDYVPGLISTIRLGVDAAMIVGGQQIPVVIATYDKVGEVVLQPGEGATITSTASGVVTVGPDGSLQAVGVGSATIKATIAGKSSSVLVNVEASRPELINRYSFSDAAGSATVVDSVGAQDGTVIGVDGVSAVTLANGKASFPGGAFQTAAYIDLPNGLISTRTNITIETWATWNGPSASQWQRIWDFGDSQKGEDAHAAGNGLDYLFLSPNSGGGTLRFAAKPSATVAESPVLDGKAALPINKEVHVVVVYSPQAKRSSLYLDGVKIASGLAPLPLSGINDVNNWIGASQWNDPAFNGSINELRIWEGGFSDLDVALSRSAGPDTIRSAPGALKSISAPVPPLLQYSPGAQCTVLADFENSTGVDITSVAGLVFSSSDKTVFTVNTNGFMVPVNPGSATIRVSFQNQSVVAPVTVVAPTAVRFGSLNYVGGTPPVQAEILADFGPQALNQKIAGFAGLVVNGGSPGVANVSASGLVTPGAAGSAAVSVSFHGLTASGTITVTAPEGFVKGKMVHRYSFADAADSTSAVDSVSGADGSVVGGGVFNGTGKLRLNGTDGYVNLPNGIISALTNATFEGWVTWEGPSSQNWSRIFDFGSSVAGEDGAGGGLSFLFLTPRNSASGKMRFDVRADPSAPDSTVLDSLGVLPSGAPVHFAVAYDLYAGFARVYVNGIRSGTAPASVPLTKVEDINNWLGRSQYNDPYFKGSYDEFRIYDGPLTDGDIAASFAAGPDAVLEAPKPSLTAVAKAGGVTISWPAEAAGYTLEFSPALGAGASWQTVSAVPVVNGGAASVDLNTTGYYRLRK